MRKLALILCLLLGIFLFYHGPVKAHADTPVYGLIKDSAVLYQSGAVVTSLPPTYFVIILDETQTHYTVSYLDISGQVEKAYIEKVDYEPKTKTAAFNFTATNGGQAVRLYSAPDETAVHSGEIPSGARAFMYGSAEGRQLAPLTYTTWYYVKYNDVRGYVYWAHGTADPFTANLIEKVETAGKPSDTAPDTRGFSTEWLYVLMLCIPAIVMMLALFSRKKAAS